MLGEQKGSPVPRHQFSLNSLSEGPPQARALVFAWSTLAQPLMIVGNKQQTAAQTP
jgi:hypothetical protein